MKLSNTFDVPLAPDAAWKLIMDIPRIVTCLPGAELVDVVDDKTYKGKVSVKLGPVALSFLGTVRFMEIDEAARTAVVKAQGADQKGRGGANAVVNFSLSSTTDRITTVLVETDLNLSGSVAQYGRASGMIESVAIEMTDEFSSNLRRQIEQSKAPVAHADGAERSTPEAPVQAKPISGFSLMFRAFRRRIARMFGGN